MDLQLVAVRRWEASSSVDWISSRESELKLRSSGSTGRWDVLQWQWTVEFIGQRGHYYNAGRDPGRVMAGVFREKKGGVAVVPRRGASDQGLCGGRGGDRAPVRGWATRGCHTGSPRDESGWASRKEESSERGGREREKGGRQLTGSLKP